MRKVKKSVSATRSYVDKSKSATNTVADRPKSFAVLTGTILTQEFEAETSETFYPTIETGHAPVLTSELVLLYAESKSIPPPGYRFIIRIDTRVEEQMKRKPVSVSMEFEFHYDESDPDKLVSKTQDFNFEFKEEEDIALDGFWYKQFIFVCGNVATTAGVEFDQVQLFDVSDDSALGFPKFLTVWPGKAKSRDKIKVALAEMLPDIETTNDASTDPED